MRSTQKLDDTLKNLKSALKIYSKNEDPVTAAAIAKFFEVAFEYTWKLLKDHVNESGLEAYSPRDVIKAAGQSGVIEDVEMWLGFLEDRNLSVHDYIGIDNKDYLKSIRQFLIEADSFLKKVRRKI